MPHRSPHDAERRSQSHPSSPDSPIPARPKPTRTVGTPADQSSPRWEQRYRPPSQREPLRHEPSHRENTNPEDGARAPRWKSPEDLPEGEAVDAPVEAGTVDNAPAQWSVDTHEALAREALARRGRKLSPRRAKRLAQRAQRRHAQARQKLKRPRRPLWRVLRAIAFLLAIGACVEFGAAALTAPQFAVDKVTSNPVVDTPVDALEAAKAELVGQNFFRAHMAQPIAELEKLPTVKEVSIRRQFDWPPRLHISVTERQPFARLSDGAQWWVVDQEGVPFRQAEERDAQLHAVSSKALKPQVGERLPEKDWAPVMEFSQALAEDTRKGHDWALRAIYFDEHSFASLRLASGVNTGADATNVQPVATKSASRDRMLVHLGIGPWAKKLERARQALGWLEAKGLHAETLNLVSYRRPVWTPRAVEQDKQQDKEISRGEGSGSTRADSHNSNRSDENDENDSSGTSPDNPV